MSGFKEFLKSKAMHYKRIDFERFFKFYDKYKSYMSLPKCIQIIGTNGKGSTGRFLSLMLKNEGLKVGHFTSPHIFDFNERFWKDGEILSDKKLQKAHEKLFNIAKDEAEDLSYFEYSTALAAFAFEDCDFLVLEAGMGGEYDATSAYEKILSILCPVAFDHEEFLGTNIKDISLTKLRSIRSNDLLLSTQDFDEVNNIAKEFARSQNIKLFFASKNLSHDVEKYAKKHGLADFLAHNLQSAKNAMELLGYKPNLDKLQKLDLHGRYEKIAPNITIDVGHNPHSAKFIAKELKPKSVVLIYNSFKDKNISLILSTLAFAIKSVQIIPFACEGRELDEDSIKQTLNKLNIPFSYYNHHLNEDENYLVYGSFHVIEAFLSDKR